MEYRVENLGEKQVGTSGEGPLFEGKRCLITGASSGIGYGLAERLLQRGAAEVWICSKNEERISAAANTLNEKYGRIKWAALDVCDEDAVTKFVNEMAEGGDIDYVFANAGTGAVGAFEDFSKETFEYVMGINFYGVLNADHAAVKVMLRQGHGCIINMSSMEGFIGIGYKSPYTVSKFAVYGLTESLRKEYDPQNIRFAVACPGPVVSNIWKRDITGVVHKGGAIPEGAITELEAADEILAGIEENRSVILVTDMARGVWNGLKDAPAQTDQALIFFSQTQKPRPKNK